MATNVNSNFIKDAYKNLPPVTRGLVTIGGIALAGYVVYQIYKSVSGTLAGEITQPKADKQETNDWNSELDIYNQSNSTKATLSPAQAKSIANGLFTAMDGYGTDEDAILALFNKIKNNADFAMIQSAYGVREVSSGYLNPEPNYKGTLTGTLTNELSQYWKDRINKIMQNKHIKYRV